MRDLSLGWQLQPVPNLLIGARFVGLPGSLRPIEHVPIVSFCDLGVVPESLKIALREGQNRS
jgi:hypothetical protein